MEVVSLTVVDNSTVEGVQAICRPYAPCLAQVLVNLPTQIWAPQHQELLGKVMLDPILLLRPSRVSRLYFTSSSNSNNSSIAAYSVQYQLLGRCQVGN